MKKRVYCTVVAALALLAGCTAMDLSRLKANPAKTGGRCLSFTDDIASVSASSAPPGAATTSVSQAATQIYGPLLLPHGVKPPTAPPPGAGAAPIAFAGYVALSQGALQSLPASIANDDVTQVLFKHVVKASALAQLQGAVTTRAPGAAPTSEVRKWTDEVNAYSVPSKISARQLERFADKLLDSEFLPTLVDPNLPPGGTVGSPFGTYFHAYYEGKFVDRFGKSVQKPQLPDLKSSLQNLKPVTLTITDADIAAAESVLLEFLFDAVDPTPVLGDAVDASSVTDKTKFYPGGTSDSRPTVFGTSLSHYMQIHDTGCGVTTKNIDTLVDIANAAGDRAAAIGGLSFNSVGGVGVSLGVFGKLSLGDNQTLSTMAKEAIQRFAMRLAYSSGFWLIRDFTAPPGAPGAAAVTPGPARYLEFP